MSAPKQQNVGESRSKHFNAGIAPSERGTFTEAATKHHQTVQGFASTVLANTSDYSPKMVKKANFAKNMAH